ncbi:hypothetical protein [Kaarinaea lacus]
MRIYKYMMLAGLLFVASPVIAEEGEFSIGIGAIAPNGITAKYWTTERVAIDIFGEWSINSKEYHTHADILIHDFDKIEWEGERIAAYYGIGARAKFEEDKDTRLGVRVPIGVAYYIIDVPVELFGEVAPRISLYPSTNFGLDIMIGARYRFL